MVIVSLVVGFDWKICYNLQIKSPRGTLVKYPVTNQKTECDPICATALRIPPGERKFVPLQLLRESDVFVSLISNMRTTYLGISKQLCLKRLISLSILLSSIRNCIFNNLPKEKVESLGQFIFPEFRILFKRLFL